VATDPPGGNGHSEQDFIVFTRPAGGRENVWMFKSQGLLAHEPQQRGCINLTKHFRRRVLLVTVVPHPPHHTGAAFPERIDKFITSSKHITHNASQRTETRVARTQMLL